MPKEATLLTEYTPTASREGQRDNFIKVPSLGNPDVSLIYKKTEAQLRLEKVQSMRNGGGFKQTLPQA